MANEIKITVGGINYKVRSDEPAEYLEELGSELENKLRYITKQNPYISTTMVAVMAALESLDDAKKAKKENETLRRRIARLEAENGGYAGKQMRLDDK